MSHSTNTRPERVILRPATRQPQWRRETQLMSPRARKVFRREDSGPFVYFIEEADQEGAVKIGTAVAPLGRLSELQVGNPRLLWIRALVPGDVKVEGQWHDRWELARERGEWFDCGYREAILAMADAAADDFLAGRSANHVFQESLPETLRGSDLTYAYDELRKNVYCPPHLR